MNSVFNYYNNKSIPYTMGGRRRKKTMPLLLGLKGRKILDVGCSSGFVGEVLKKQGNYVVGIDITQKDITKAKKVLNEAYVFDIEQDNLAKLGKNYDLLVMGEVAEHLFDPEAAIARLLPLLKPSGEILISTPNLVHIYNRLKMTLGLFEYKEETVINKSHIHFFTYVTFKKALKNLNLRTLKENNVVLPETLSGLWKHWPNMFVFQMVFLCKKK